MITVTFGCGHQARLESGGLSAPTCPICGHRRIARTVAPPPRFRGACSGPCAETVRLEPTMVALAPGGPLRLKPETYEE